MKGLFVDESSRPGRLLATAMGASCAGIGVVHSLTGASSVIGLDNAGPDEDSQERFYGGMFAVYGLAWLHAARTEPIDFDEVKWLAAAMTVGGLARVTGLAAGRRPHRFWQAMTVVELTVPGMIVWLLHPSRRDPAGNTGMCTEIYAEPSSDGGDAMSSTSCASRPAMPSSWGAAGGRRKRVARECGSS